MNGIFICCIMFVVFIVLVAVYAKLYSKYKDKYEKEHNKLVGLQAEYSTLLKAYEIKKNNKEKADETINALHNGTLSADDVLPKR